MIDGPPLDENVVVASVLPEPNQSHVEKQIELEIELFLNFTAACAYNVSSLKSCLPPEPDLLCAFDGGERYFELACVVDERLTHKITGKDPAKRKSFIFSQRSPLSHVIAQKAQKYYETNGKPVDLLLYFDIQPADSESLSRDLQTCIRELEAALANTKFSRVMVFDNWSRTTLWRS